jgi:hypothetical protein
VRVAKTNRGAIPFWMAVVAEYAHGVFEESERPGWRVLSFEIESPRPDRRRPGG